MIRLGKNLKKADNAAEPVAMPDCRAYARFYFWWPTPKAVGYDLEGSS